MWVSTTLINYLYAILKNTNTPSLSEEGMLRGIHYVLIYFLSGNVKLSNNRSIDLLDTEDIHPSIAE
jgi:hypothetical protein